MSIRSMWSDLITYIGVVVHTSKYHFWQVCFIKISLSTEQTSPVQAKNDCEYSLNYSAFGVHMNMSGF